MKVVAIIQARMGSTRLPGKVLADLGGRPALAWTVRAAGAVPGIDRAVVATSEAAADDAVAKWCEGAGVPCHRGPEDDVLARYHMAARAEGAETIMRLTADCPLLDPMVCGEVLMLLEREGADYASNVDPRSWPDGLDCEVFTAAALDAAAAEAESPMEREHVTPFIQNRRHRFRILNVTCPVPGLASERWTLDTPEDLEFLAQVIARLPTGDTPPSYMDVVRVLDAEPELRDINGGAPAQDYGVPGGDIAGFGHERSQALLERAEKAIPLGSQTFSKSHIQFPPGSSPLFLTHGEGARVWDVDGNEYVDLICGLLPVVLGYRDPDVDLAIRRQLDSGISFSLATALEAELAERLAEIIPCAEKTRFAKNGTDATSAAVRLARAHTGRERVAVCGYHGWQDWYIGTTSRNKGVPGAVRELSHAFPYNDLEALDRLLASHGSEFAAVVMEPMNTMEPGPGYLSGVLDLARRHGALLVFDEIITGFRFALGGAQELFGVTPDLACFGKAMGNGMPISAVTGRADVMAEMEEIFFSATFGGETLSLAAAIAVIDKMRSEPVIETLWRNGARLAEGVLDRSRRHGLDDVVSIAGRAPWTFVQFADHEAAGRDAIKTFFMAEMIAGGVLVQHSHNVCYALTETDIDHVLAVYERAFASLAERLEAGGLEEQMGNAVIRPIFEVR
ncbi:MAG: aminotransferase class III-fold pyridoxal phosphate-dependent enzyme [Proteobacteria bacterium]|nr:aminotransferase class III-fold pyridoxal phosphate-dependent enzyme [Pseudomonadota bacterium]